MKKNKKILSLISILALLVAIFMITSCGKKTPEELYEAASKNMSEAKDVKIDDGKMTAKLDFQGQKIEVLVDFSGQYIKATGDDPRDLQAMIKAKMNLPNGEKKFSLYIKDKMVYMYDGLAKTKDDLGISKKDAKELFDNSKPIKIDELVKEKKQDGDKITFKLDGKKYMEELLKRAENKDTTKDDLKEMKEVIDTLKVKDITLETTIVKEKFTSLKYKIPMELDGDVFGLKGETLKVDVGIDIPNISTNSGSKIEYPDLKAYK